MTDFLLETLTVGPLESNCYIIADPRERDAVIIDPGWDAPRILKVVRTRDLTPKFIVATHGHFDHVSAVNLVRKEMGVPFLIHAAERETLAFAKRGALGLFGAQVPDPPVPDGFLREGDVLRAGSVHLTVLHTPGHSPGGISLKGDGLVFTGDTLFEGGVGRTDVGGSWEQLMQSIRSKVLPLGDAFRVYPGHGPPTTVGKERLFNPFLADLHE